MSSSASEQWDLSDIPDQSGTTAIVTGANSGLGEVTANALAAKGAHVILACRNVEKGMAAAARMDGDVVVRGLDVADLASVRQFADSIESVDVLVNNAGVMAVPEAQTVDGFELQLGTNFLGAFALTGLLLPRITGRVVMLSSLAHRIGRIDLDDLNWRDRPYLRWPAYGQSKLADLTFAFELHRRLVASGSSVRSLAAHPGMARTELHTHTDPIQAAMIAGMTRLGGQSSTMGALPILFAATSPDAQSGEYYGPGGIGEVQGYPRRAASSKRSHDPVVAEALWNAASELTGVEFLSPPAADRALVPVGGTPEPNPATAPVLFGLAASALVGGALAVARSRRGR
jgi:NAD(P)-dependent dehydrogenase (short-subunit alcohol dehydrogenase family)